MPRPVLFVLAGVNGAGKSSIGGHLLQSAGQAWFNPDTYARELVAELGYPQTEAMVWPGKKACAVWTLRWPRATAMRLKPPWAATPCQPRSRPQQPRTMC